jgi:hypothetical protein
MMPNDRAVSILEWGGILYESKLDSGVASQALLNRYCEHLPIILY